MSLILEALRKSEAERRRGQVPDLHAEPSPGTRTRGDGPPAWLWPTLALATVVVLAIALWLSRSAPPLASPAVDPPIAATGPSEGRTVGSDGDSGPGDETDNTDGASGMPDDRASTGVLPASMPPANSPTAVATTPASPSVEPASSTPPAPLPAIAEAQGPAAPPATPPAPALAPARMPPPVPAVAATPAPNTLPAAGLSPTATAPPNAAAGPSPLRLSDLTGAQRQQLPPLKMSMHMHSSTQQFAIIDGERVAAGDRIGNVVVEEITANGVVLGWQGQRLQIPIR